ncbi:efflux RND transporter periplasmic adaptor subunit [Hymenobacter wooponensis]|uniref:HlyD family efflux transporter periplasmic adaptor subunit n=1 Tax=Hymenobacter wooponensis TaxID=1525360 RepID=A0A4Z0MJK0_9BACT|nr:efflux RND transporter periplasmic adaptor subunit [Hymenobacter wooponensis]TGD79530.1 HlyD family efflux transporter periplasmic adaptor subunit [Hymenobacter wooponensis]
MSQHYLLLLASGVFLSLQPAALRLQRPLSAAPPRHSVALPIAQPARETISRPGVVEPICTLPLLTTTHGWVRQVFFEEGDFVRRRQILLKFMYNTEYSSQFNRNYVLAPRAGFVEHKNVAVGGHLKAGARVATLLDVSQVKVVVAVPTQTGRALKLCDQVPVRIAELPTRRFMGVVDYIQHPTSTFPAYLITVTVRNHLAPLIRPRMHAHVQLPTRRLPALVAQQ